MMLRGGVSNIGEIIHGDCIQVMQGMESNSVDSIVTDPPAGIAFMSKDWDKDKGGRAEWIAWMESVAAECIRVLKPGGHALVWAIPRTSHWTGMAWENAGWEPRDKIYHVFGSGFPKSANISKHIDKMAGVKPDTQYLAHGNNKIFGEGKGKAAGVDRTPGINLSDSPATLEAKQWEGWGTALKPAIEEWWLLRKPLSEKTIAKNVLRWGTGGINIDGCRVGTDEIKTHGKRNGKGTSLEWSKYKSDDNYEGGTHQGRFPATLVHDGSEEVLKGFPQTGASRAGLRKNKNTTTIFEKGFEGEPKDIYSGHNDEGSASRYFYCAKASKKERGEGNNHPTVKSLALMRYLCRLITPPNGIVLDPFAGSGSTLVAAGQEGFRGIGIEMEEDSVEIARSRLSAVKDSPQMSIDGLL